MARYDLPTPQTAAPLPLIDPYRNRPAYLRVLSLLYHAESAALVGFRLLNDERFVQANDLFAKSSALLIADESRHIADIEHLVELLGVGGIQPPSPEEAEFWTAWRRGDLFALPYKPSVAALFCLFSEGLGYAFLYNLAQATSDPEFKAVLLANVEDEKAHLRLSLTILRRALERQKGALLADFLVYMAGYVLIARAPVQAQRTTVEALGLSFELIAGSSFHFVFELLKLVVAETGQDSATWRLLGRLSQVALERPRLLRTLFLGARLPEPPLVRRAVWGWGRLGLLRAGVAPTQITAEVLVA